MGLLASTGTFLQFTKLIIFGPVTAAATLGKHCTRTKPDPRDGISPQV